MRPFQLMNFPVVSKSSAEQIEQGCRHIMLYILSEEKQCVVVGFYSSEQIQSSGLLLLVLSGSFGTSMCPLCCLKQNSPDPRGCMLSSLIEEA